MPDPATLIAGGGALLKGIGGIISGRSRRQQEQRERARLLKERAKAHRIRETARIGGLRGLQQGVLARGIKGGPESFDPSAFTERPFTDTAERPSTGSTFGDVLSGLGSAGLSIADLRQQQEEEKQRREDRNQILCAVYPQLCPDTTLMGPTQAELEYEGDE